jgi:rare lipoprotein A
LLSAAVLLAACASKPPTPTKRSKEYFPESVYGVKASPRVVEYGQPVPQGGGRYLVGNAYKVKGRTYTPKEYKRYTAVGYASWYGSAFHGRRTANGEVYDMDTLSAAHPTMPLPSYARVTNLRNGSSVVVRVNDRGPYERDRVIDLSAKTAEMLDVRRHGSVKVKVEYVGPARMEGHDKQMLMASYVPPRGGMPVYRDAPPASRNTMIAMTPPSKNPSVVLAMVPIPRSRPDLEGGVAIDPYQNYEIQAASIEAPRSGRAARNDAAFAATEAPDNVAVPQVVQASAAGEGGYPEGGTNYGERTLGTFTTSEPISFAPATGGSARSSYAESSSLSPAQIAAETMAYPGRQKLQVALAGAVARQAAERSAELVEIQVGVYSSADNAAVIGGKIGRLGHVRIADVSVGGKSMQAVRLYVDPSIGGDAALQAVADAGARGAYVVTR